MITPAQIAMMNKPIAGFSLTRGKIDALIASSYNLHIQEGQAMDSAAAAKLPRGDRAMLCKILAEKGGSDLYTQAQASEALQIIVDRLI
jgi:hypothetical protein